ncbi:MAG: DUF1464 family protein [Desulfurococcales archaeon]|nr:DUF1464 family protein [Desulfurococcales archaeon]
MVRALGIDPGTGSMDILAIDDESMKVLFEESVPRDAVTRDPSIIIDVVRKVDNDVGLDAIVAPSGYGIPLKPVSEASYEEICEATFIHGRDWVARLRIVGLRELMKMFKHSSLPAWFTPGVIHLPTVPRWRKANKIDLGTADKVYSVAAALWGEVDERGTPLGDVRIIVVEAGLAYNAALAVKGGAIVDGVGGTSGPPGFLGMGFMDAELAYALSHVEPGFSKARLFQGGASSLAEVSSLEMLEKLYGEGHPSAVEAVNMMAESMVKAVMSLVPSLGDAPERVYVSGRIFRLDRVGSEVRKRLREALGLLGGGEVVETPRLGSRTKEGATGAALIASGLAGGRFKWLVEALRLKESQGSIFDHVMLDRDVVEALKAEFRYCRL